MGYRRTEIDLAIQICAIPYFFFIATLFLHIYYDKFN